MRRSVVIRALGIAGGLDAVVMQAARGAAAQVA
jgi:hypothetical protein